jgi:DNA-binding CsgD family transcriptional regulator
MAGSTERLMRDSGMADLHSDAPISGFLEATFGFLQPLLGARRVAFYRVDQTQDLHDFVRVHLPQAFGIQYGQAMSLLDPLHVRRIAHEPAGVSLLDAAATLMPAAQVRSYRDFLGAYDIGDTAELIFRHAGDVRAGISVFWGKSERRPAHIDAEALANIHRYIGYNMSRFLISEQERAEQAGAAMGLTQREAEITKLLSLGRSNHDIAQCLSLSLATVKTHLIHIFAKTGADSRTALANAWLEASRA